MYLEEGKRIFKRLLWGRINQLKGFIGSQFDNNGLSSLLSEYFGERRVSDCVTPLLVTSYDIRHDEMKKFSSRYCNRISQGFNENKNYRLTDVCLSTAAAPTYFKSHSLKHESSAVRRLCIDGGIYVNNPTLIAISEVLRYNNDPIYTFGNDNTPINLEDIQVLSLGTGRSAISLSRNDGGYYYWGKNIVDVMMRASSLAINEQAKAMLCERYLRFDVELDGCETKFTSTTESVLKEWKKRANSAASDRSGFHSKLSTYLDRVR